MTLFPIPLCPQGAVSALRRGATGSGQRRGGANAAHGPEGLKESRAEKVADTLRFGMGAGVSWRPHEPRSHEPAANFQEFFRLLIQHNHY